MPIRWNKLLIILFFIAVHVSFSQEKNPTVYPYGGVPDSSRFQSGMGIIPLNFKEADFTLAKFHNQAYLEWAQFYSLIDFTVAQFDSLANFKSAIFHSLADFRQVQFDGLADFKFTKFDSILVFRLA